MASSQIKLFFSSKVYRKKFVEFVRRRTLLYLATGIVAAFFVVLVEFALGYAMQNFLVVLGVAKDSIIMAPKWLPPPTLEWTLVTISALSISRSVLLWLQGSMQQSGSVFFMSTIKNRISEWVLYGKGVDYPNALSIFVEKATVASSCLLSFQMFIFQMIVTLCLGANLFITMPIPTLTGVLVLVTLVPVLKILAKKAESLGKQHYAHSAISNQRILFVIKNALLIRIYATQQKELDSLVGATDASRQFQSKFIFSHHLSGVLPNAFGVIVISSITYVLSRTNQDNAGVIVAYFYLFFRFLQNGAATAQLFSSFTFAKSGFVDVAKWWISHSLDSPESSQTRQPKRPFPSGFQAPYGWKVENLSFKYPGAETRIFENLNLDIAPGHAFAVIGPSGVGKSTLVALLLGQLQQQEGNTVIVDSTQKTLSLAEYSETLLDNVGYVGPDPMVFGGNVLENLCYGLLRTPSEAEAQLALRQAGCDFVFDRPEGMALKLNDLGEGLSAGQKQRISLARALLRRPSVLVLDEATSNLDATTEAALISTLQGLKRNMTLLIITHRESMLTLADRVLKLSADKNALGAS